MFSTSSRLFPVVFASFALAACAPAEEHTVHDGTTATSDDGEVNITWTVASGAVMREGNVFKLTLKDAAGVAAFDGASGTLEFSSDESDTVVIQYASDGAAGLYVAPAHTFAIGGEWHLTVHVSRGEEGAADHVHDHATFKLSVP